MIEKKCYDILRSSEKACKGLVNHGVLLVAVSKKRTLLKGLKLCHISPLRFTTIVSKKRTLLKGLKLATLEHKLYFSRCFKRKNLAKRIETRFIFETVGRTSPSFKRKNLAQRIETGL
ncbi:hypothetical protein [Seinonella peptonophila]|uniref:hypothetical protein n=1 Tax=Seinonella peptonophila TaxID=112248 RepID=UPI0011148B3E|nr:hypothetical protein [Seinonella peptonophila]